jgi:hypothetical protein
VTSLTYNGSSEHVVRIQTTAQPASPQQHFATRLDGVSLCTVACSTPSPIDVTSPHRQSPLTPPFSPFYSNYHHLNHLSVSHFFPSLTSPFIMPSGLPLHLFNQPELLSLSQQQQQQITTQFFTFLQQQQQQEQQQQLPLDGDPSNTSLSPAPPLNLTTLVPAVGGNHGSLSSSSQTTLMPWYPAPPICISRLSRVVGLVMKVRIILRISVFVFEAIFCCIHI